MFETIMNGAAIGGGAGLLYHMFRKYGWRGPERDASSGFIALNLGRERPKPRVRRSEYYMTGVGALLEITGVQWCAYLHMSKGVIAANLAGAVLIGILFERILLRLTAKPRAEG